MLTWCCAGLLGFRVTGWELTEARHSTCRCNYCTRLEDAVAHGAARVQPRRPLTACHAHERLPCWCRAMHLTLDRHGGHTCDGAPRAPEGSPHWAQVPRSQSPKVPMQSPFSGPLNLLGAKVRILAQSARSGSPQEPSVHRSSRQLVSIPPPSIV